MADIALISGVSVTTISHVVNKTRSVSPETERAVLAAIAETGYMPDNVVRTLRRVGSQTVGLAMSMMSNPYFGDVVRGIETAATRSDYSLLLAETHDDVASELRAVSDLLSRRVEAIILAPSADPVRALQHAEHQGVPVVLIDRFMNADLDQIGVENIEPTAGLVDHLCSIGHRRIGMVSGRPGLSTTEERTVGFRQGLRRNRLRFYSDYLVSGDSDDETAEQALLQLLSLPKPPTAIVVGNNRMTIGVMRAARDARVRIPEDLAIVSFDDFEWADLFHPSLTAVAQPTKAMGEQALQLVLSRLADPSTPTRRVVMRSQFVHRESCGCAPQALTSAPPGRSA